MTSPMRQIDDAAIGTAIEASMHFASLVELSIETLTVLIVPDARTYEDPRAYDVILRVIRASSGGWRILPESNQLPDLMVMVCGTQVARTAFAISDDALPLEGGPHVVTFDGESGSVRISRRGWSHGANA